VVRSEERGKEGAFAAAVLGCSRREQLESEEFLDELGFGELGGSERDYILRSEHASTVTVKVKTTTIARSLLCTYFSSIKLHLTFTTVCYR
jgi:hypothetical protein